jgi:plasmid maintenance system antidote protein VapI
VKTNARDIARRGRPRRHLAERVLLRWARGEASREIAGRLKVSHRHVNRIIAEYRPLAEELAA